MIRFSNGHEAEYFVASGSLAWDGEGWPWERPLVWTGLIDPSLFTVVIKSLTLKPIKGNLSWWHPWSCVRLLPGNGAVNKVGLTNPGMAWWMRKVAPKVDRTKIALVGSIFGPERDLVEMTETFNDVDLVGVEINPSCPNAGAMPEPRVVARSTEAVANVSKHPLILKLSVAQDYLEIERMVRGMVQAISLNSVPFGMVFPNGRSPLWRLEERVGGGGGGVSGVPAQALNWKAVYELAKYGETPVIAPSIMLFGNMGIVRQLGADAVSFGAIHLPSHPIWLRPWTLLTNPCKPTRFVKSEQMGLVRP